MNLAILPQPKESQIQQALIKWWALSWRKYGVGDERVLMAFPLQGLRTARNGARMKAEGMRAGTPDLFLAVPRGKYHGFFIELKRPKGKLSESQAEMGLFLLKSGYCVSTAYGFDDAINKIDSYLLTATFRLK